jgi:hypothetical protein
MMRMTLFAVALLLIAGFAAQPTYSSDTDKAVEQSIQNVISSQMEAFKAGDASKSFSFAAPHIQAQFGNPDRFMQMVRHGYQPVYKPKYVEFAHLAMSQDGQYAQHVIVQAPSGEVMMAVYPMIQDEDGNWRIAGVHLAKLPRKST